MITTRRAIGSNCYERPVGTAEPHTCCYRTVYVRVGGAVVPVRVAVCMDFIGNYYPDPDKGIQLPSRAVSARMPNRLQNPSYGFQAIPRYR